MNGWSQDDYNSWISRGGGAAPSPEPSLDQQAQQYGWTPEYKQTQEDMGAIRQLMATQGAGYMVTGNASMADGGNSTAYLPQMMNDNGIKPTTGILGAYQGVTGQEWKPGDRITGFNNAGTSGTYNIQGANGQSGVTKPTGYGGQVAQPAWQPVNTKPEQIGQTNLKAPARMNVNPNNLVSLIQRTPLGQTLGTTSGQQPPDPGSFARSLDWSPENSAESTRILEKAKIENGWTDAQIGAALGFTADQVREHFARNNSVKPGPGQPAPGTPATPSPNQPAQDPGAFARTLDWSPANTANATQQMLAAKAQYGWTDDQIGAALGFTGEQIKEHFAKYNSVKPSPVAPGGTPPAGSGSGGGSGGGQAPGSQPPSGNPVVNRSVDGKTETIEGRIGNLLATDASGNYTNPVIQQAANSAMQQFAGRGLLNSSMATEAAYQAAMSKAIEIAGPDAQTYFAQGRANQDASNVFERDARGYAQENARLDKTMNMDMQKFDRELQYRYDALKIDKESQAEARALAQKYAIEMEEIKAVNTAYEMYLRRISDIDANPEYSAETKIKMKNEIGKDFDLYAKTKKVSWQMDLGNRFTAASPDKPVIGVPGSSGSGGVPTDNTGAGA